MPRHGTVSLDDPAHREHQPREPRRASLRERLRLAVQPAETELEAAIQPDPDYSDRPGFDPDFLGFAAPLPTLLPEAGDLALPVEDGVELKYHHYSVIMNSERKLAFVSAVNLDAGAKFQLNREGKDRWFYDPRIDRDAQIGDELYGGNPLDRGHLTRRADAAWGDTEEEARLANDDTFHWTNCSPQHEVFNQSTKANERGILLWGNLENHVVEQADNGKLSVFNGPIFRTNDRIYRGEQDPARVLQADRLRQGRRHARSGGLHPEPGEPDHEPAGGGVRGRPVPALPGQDQRPRSAHQARFRRLRARRSAGRGGS